MAQPAGSIDLAEGAGVLLFDGDCGFCTRSAEWAQRYVRPGCQVIAWQFAPTELTEPLRERLEGSIVVLRGGEQLDRGAAVAAVLISSPRRGWRLLGRLIRLPLLRNAADLGYRAVAANRYRLPGGTPACAVRRS